MRYRAALVTKMALSGRVAPTPEQITDVHNLLVMPSWPGPNIAGSLNSACLSHGRSPVTGAPR
jgi:hypothetical protein